jgi:Ni2+-binding GTPase involved in maturation of urease and hydrogenase
MAVAGDRGGSADDNDARRIAACGVPVVRIYTSTMCHLDAQMVADACRRLAPAPGTMVMVENIGNLVCPALFDLGGAARVVVASVTEGDDKPAKYLYTFETADLVVLNKCDLLPYVPFDPERFEASLHDVNRDAGGRSCPGDARRRAAGVKRLARRAPGRSSPSSYSLQAKGRPAAGPADRPASRFRAPEPTISAQFGDAGHEPRGDGDQPDPSSATCVVRRASLEIETG